jgi:protein TonB
MRVKTRSLALVCLLAFSISALAGSRSSFQEPNVRADLIPARSTSDPISADEIKELYKRLEGSIETQIKFENDPVAPLLIDEASVRSVHRENRADLSAPGNSTAIDYFACRLRIVVKNPSSSEVNGFVLLLADGETKFRLYRSKVSVAPGKKETINVEFIFVPTDPANLVGSLYGARFSNGVIWGKFPVNPPMPQPAPPQSAPPTQPAIDSSSVPETPQNRPVASADEASRQALLLQTPAAADSRPRALNSPMASYTERARKNGVMGTVILRALVGADGEVKAVRVVRGLPDFLTEEAIKAALQIKFNPAIKNGQPVSFWQAVTIDFDLR